MFPGPAAVLGRLFRTLLCHLTLASRKRTGWPHLDSPQLLRVYAQALGKEFVPEESHLLAEEGALELGATRNSWWCRRVTVASTIRTWGSCSARVFENTMM